MDIINFLQTEIDPMDDSDIRNGCYMRDVFEFDDYKLTKLPQVSLKESFVKSLETFKLYRNNQLLEKLMEEKKHMDYLPLGLIPFHFSTQFFVGEHNQVLPTIMFPGVLDKASYAFFGHEFHHALKDVNPIERQIRDRVSEVIPMFYEMLCSEFEEDKVVSKEIIKRRFSLIQLDKMSETDEPIRRLQYFNSCYYALALYNKYREDENKLLILRLITRVLNGEINTMDLLEMLNIYGEDLDYNVSYELDMMKKYVLK